MPLHPKIKPILDAISASTPFHKMSPQEARAALLKSRASNRTPEAVAMVTDLTCPGPGGDIPLRMYKPAKEGKLPVVVYFHGGGWVIGSIDIVDAACRALANLTGCIFVAAGYRLAPEHKFPAAIEDAYAATAWLAANAESFDGNPSRIAVVGESVGGNLAAVTAMLARERNGPALKFQMMLYPVLNHDFAAASWKELGVGYSPTAETMQWFWTQYVTSEADYANPHASPMRADSLAGLPPAAIFAAECDPLRDEAEAYANRLRAEGVPVQYKLQPGLIHGYMGMAATIEPARVALEDAAASLRAALHA